MAYTEEELAALTDEEREAMQQLDEQNESASDEDPEVDLDNEEEFHDQLPGDRIAQEQESEDEGEEGKKAAAADEGAAAAAEGDGAGDEGNAVGTDGDRPQDALPPPLLVAEAPADAEAQLQKIAEDKAALVEKFDDGELTAKEYQAELDKLNKQERTIERQLDKAQIAADLEHQRQVNEREQSINAFLAEVKIPRDPANLRFITLDGAVRLVASKEENANLRPREILQKAYDLCVSEGTLQPAKQEPKAKEPAPKKAIDAPKTLANLPAAEISDTSDARFAHINRIKDPEAREAAFAQLSPADQDAYLAMGG